MLLLKILLSFFTLTSLMFMMISLNPLTVGMLLIIQSMLIASLISVKSLFSWFSFFIFIIYLGGILMLFSYIISLTNFKEPIFKKSPTKTIFFFSFIISITMISEKMTEKLKMMNFFKMISLCFSHSSMKLTIFLMLFLLMIMIMVVYISETSKSSMRSNF